MDTPAIFKSTPVILYRDLYFRLIGSLTAAHIIVAYGETLTIFQMLLMPTYYFALIPSFIIALILFSIIRAICIRLDKKFDWTVRTVERIALQLFFGGVIPAICAFLLASGYFALRGVNIFTTTYLQYDFQFILSQLLLINLYYVIYYFYQKSAHAQKAIAALVAEKDGAVTESKRTFQVNGVKGSILFDVDEVAYFFRQDDSNFLRTKTKEDYFVNAALDDVYEQLPEDTFFRANRQLIVHRQACKGYDLLTYGKLQTILEPPFEDAVISQKRAAAFKKWLDP